MVGTPPSGPATRTPGHRYRFRLQPVKGDDDGRMTVYWLKSQGHQRDEQVASMAKALRDAGYSARV